MSFETWLLFAVTALGMSITPGPTGLLYLTHGMQFGGHKSLYTLLGCCVGFVMTISISLAGMGALLMASEAAFGIAKWLGAAYLIYIGIKTWQAPSLSINQDNDDIPQASRLRLFSQGFFVAAGNPKAILFFAAFLPQFMQASSPWLPQYLQICATIVFVEFVYGTLLCRAASKVAPWLGERGRLLNRASGAAFIALGGVLTRANRI